MCSDRVASTHVVRDFDVNWTKIKGDCQSYTKAAHQDSKSDSPLMKLCFIKKDQIYIWIHDRELDGLRMV